MIKRFALRIMDVIGTVAFVALYATALTFAALAVSILSFVARFLSAHGGGDE